MSAAQWPATYRLIDDLLENPHKYQFFQAVRVLARAVQIDEKLDGDRVVGERIRFGSSLSLAFPPSEIESLKKKAIVDGKPGGYRLVPAFIGMSGPNGAMPRYYTEMLAERQFVYRDDTAHAFMNMFTNRMVALYYRASQKYRLALRHESGHRFLSELLSFSGYRFGLSGDDRTPSRSAVEPYAAYAGLLRNQTVSAENLRRVLADYFETEVDVEQFVGQWIAIPVSQQTQLGVGMATLGDSACCGERLWDRQTRLRLRFGPMRQHRYRAMLPDGVAAAELRELLQYWCGISVEFEVQLLLHRDDVRSVKLGGDMGQLGRDAIMCSRPVAHHVGEARYLLN